LGQRDCFLWFISAVSPLSFQQTSPLSFGAPLFQWFDFASMGIDMIHENLDHLSSKSFMGLDTSPYSIGVSLAIIFVLLSGLFINFVYDKALSFFKKNSSL